MADEKENVLSYLEYKAYCKEKKEKLTMWLQKAETDLKAQQAKEVREYRERAILMQNELKSQLDALKTRVLAPKVKRKLNVVEFQGLEWVKLGEKNVIKPIVPVVKQSSKPSETVNSEADRLSAMDNTKQRPDIVKAQRDLINTKECLRRKQVRESYKRMFSLKMKVRPIERHLSTLNDEMVKKVQVNEKVQLTCCPLTSVVEKASDRDGQSLVPTQKLDERRAEAFK